MAFHGWPVEALEFYEGLEADNSKAYWQRNREVYETKVRAPMEALLEELAPEWGEGRPFRPYRDVRFSQDKTPYKTHIGAMVGEFGYVQLNADGLAAGSGIYDMAPDQLERFRAAVAAEGSGGELAELVAGARAAGQWTYPLRRGQRWPDGSSGWPHTGHGGRPAATVRRDRSAKARARVGVRRTRSTSGASGSSSDSSSSSSSSSSSPSSSSSSSSSSFASTRARASTTISSLSPSQARVIVPTRNASTSGSSSGAVSSSPGRSASAVMAVS